MDPPLVATGVQSKNLIPGAFAILAVTAKSQEVRGRVCPVDRDLCLSLSCNPSREREWRGVHGAAPPAVRERLELRELIRIRCQHKVPINMAGLCLRREGYRELNELDNVKVSELDTFEVLDS